MNPPPVPVRILLIEDDIDDFMIFRDALNESKLHVELKTATRCNNILDIMKNMEDRPPQIIFLDLHMPMVSGHECLTTIRSISAFDTIPVVIYSTSASADDIENTFKGGANLYLTKPSSFQLLVTALKNILQLDWQKNASEKNRLSFVYKHQPLNQAV